MMFIKLGNELVRFTKLRDWQNECRQHPGTGRSNVIRLIF